MIPEKYVRFDWAVKTLLRDKSNFGVLAGLVSVLLNEKITIEEILESESNMLTDADKFDRVDIKAKNSKNEIIIVEVQQRRESDFLNRILYGVSKSITEHISIGDDYNHVKKIYSINILYFNLGKGSDYLYHGQTTFTGVNTHDTLQITEQQQRALAIKTPEEIFPEYYIIRVNEFDKVATTPLEEWLDYLKNGRIKDDTTTPGLDEAREKLLYMVMSKEEQNRYFRHMDSLKLERDAMESSRLDGLWEGRREGLEEGLQKGLEKGREEGLQKGLEEGLQKGLEKGREEGLLKGLEKGREEGLQKGLEKGREEGTTERNREIASNMLTMDISIDVISQITGISADEIKDLKTKVLKK